MSGIQSHMAAWFGMGTEWQLQLYADRPLTALQSIAEAVIEEVERVEESLSFYRDTSDLRAINAAAGIEPVPLDPRVFRFLEKVQELYLATGGAFDPTIGPLLRCWGFVGSSGQMPTSEEITRCQSVVGFRYVNLNAADFSVELERSSRR